MKIRVYTRRKTFSFAKPVLLEYGPSNGTLFFGNNIKSKMGILNLNRKVYFNQKPLTKNIFLSLYMFSEMLG